METESPSPRVVLATVVVCLLAAVSTYKIAFPTKLPRTRQPSRFAEFFTRMRDDEWRAAFSVPRPLFTTIVNRLCPKLEWKYADVCREGLLW